MADVLSLALFEREGRTLMVLRKEDKPPFAGRWLLPGVVVKSEQSAEEALERHTVRELGVEIEEHVFVETLSLDDETTHRRYVANVFRVLRHRGDLRFRAEGDYADARWLSKEQLAETKAPASLRDWLRGERETAAPAGPVPLPAGGPAPDNRQAWNTIAKAYQERYQLPTDKLIYGPRCPDEEQLNLVGDVSGLHAIVLGCGGGQDCIVLAKQGAQVTGIDLSDEQITFGRRLAESEETQVTLLQGNIEELKGIDDESQDLALSL
ncbi:MAG: methyltransferase domain-containing protein, partial [Chloroflexi bacterium]|nr:methyltransferase domain-containing protein [Chloroflexota bacterium]